MKALLRVLGFVLGLALVGGFGIGGMCGVVLGIGLGAQDTLGSIMLLCGAGVLALAILAGYILLRFQSAWLGAKSE